MSTVISNTKVSNSTTTIHIQIMVFSVTGIDAAKELGIEPMITAKEMADPTLDHLSLMSYLSKFEHIKPRKGKAEWIQIRFNFDNIKTGNHVGLIYNVVKRTNAFITIVWL